MFRNLLKQTDVLDLRSDDIRRISAKELLVFSNLNTVDVRGNPCLDYESSSGDKSESFSFIELSFKRRAIKRMKHLRQKLRLVYFT